MAWHASVDYPPHGVGLLPNETITLVIYETPGLLRKFCRQLRLDRSTWQVRQRDHYWTSSLREAPYIRWWESPRFRYRYMRAKRDIEAEAERFVLQ